MTIIKHWFTERDGESFCPIRALAILGVAEYLAMAGIISYHAMNFDLQGFGAGLGIVLAAAGAAVTAKATTEAKPDA